MHLFIQQYVFIYKLLQSIRCMKINVAITAPLEMQILVTDYADMGTIFCHLK